MPQHKGVMEEESSGGFTDSDDDSVSNESIEIHDNSKYVKDYSSEHSSNKSLKNQEDPKRESMRSK